MEEFGGMAGGREERKEPEAVSEPHGLSPERQRPSRRLGRRHKVARTHAREADRIRARGPRTAAPSPRRASTAHIPHFHLLPLPPASL